MVSGQRGPDGWRGGGAEGRRRNEKVCGPGRCRRCAFSTMPCGVIRGGWRQLRTGDRGVRYGWRWTQAVRVRAQVWSMVVALGACLDPKVAGRPGGCNWKNVESSGWRVCFKDSAAKALFVQQSCVNSCAWYCKAIGGFFFFFFFFFVRRVQGLGIRGLASTCGRI